jgi:hypothetical protein
MVSWWGPWWWGVGDEASDGMQVANWDRMQGSPLQVEGGNHVVRGLREFVAAPARATKSPSGGTRRSTAQLTSRPPKGRPPITWCYCCCCCCSCCCRPPAVCTAFGRAISTVASSEVFVSARGLDRSSKDGAVAVHCGKEPVAVQTSSTDPRVMISTCGLNASSGSGGGGSELPGTGPFGASPPSSREAAATDGAVVVAGAAAPRMAVGGTVAVDVVGLGAAARPPALLGVNCYTSGAAGAGAAESHWHLHWPGSEETATGAWFSALSAPPGSGEVQGDLQGDRSGWCDGGAEACAAMATGPVVLPSTAGECGHRASSWPGVGGPGRGYKRSIKSCEPLDLEAKKAAA